MKEPSAELKKVSDIFNELKLNIPPYQRPYMWTRKNINSLLKDITNSMNKHSDKKEYRIGSIVLHNDNNTIQVVDGQQRLTTIFLILKYFNQNFGGKINFDNNFMNDSLTKDNKEFIIFFK